MGGIQSVLENSACERLSTKTVWVGPSGQSRSLQGFFGVELDLRIEAKGRSGRDVGKCGLASVDGTDDLDAPMARGEGTCGREYIMTGIYERALERVGDTGGDGRDLHARDEEEGWGGELSDRRPASGGL